MSLTKRSVAIWIWLPITLIGYALVFWGIQGYRELSREREFSRRVSDLGGRCHFESAVPEPVLSLLPLSVRSRVLRVHHITIPLNAMNEHRLAIESELGELRHLRSITVIGTFHDSLYSSNCSELFSDQVIRKNRITVLYVLH